MNKIKKNFIINYIKLFKFDTMKKLRFIEIFQYSTIGIMLALLFGRITEYYIFSNNINYLLQLNVLKKNNDKIYLNREDNITINDYFSINYNRLLLYIIISLESLLFIILIYYLKKILKLIPSIATIYNNKFIPYLTFDLSLNIAFSLILIKRIPSFQSKITALTSH
tara:strand:+ start:1529 stop:2029 length:501 start_codon:yes stop_codon:yes gene_type:complete